MPTLSLVEVLLSLATVFATAVLALLIYVWANEGPRMRSAAEGIGAMRAQAVVAQPAAAPKAAAPAVAQAPAAVSGEHAEAVGMFKAKGCIGCHVAPGIPEAVGTTGPNLTGLGSRAQLVAGGAVNAENLKKWIMDPASVKPGTLMPKLGLSDAEAGKLVAWLLSLK